MERWATVTRLHQAALECAASQRAAFLDEACGGDDALRREVESLLAYEPVASSFMEAPAVDIAAKSLHGKLDAPLVGQTLSHYHVESLLGAGGMKTNVPGDSINFEKWYRFLPLKDLPDYIGIKNAHIWRVASTPWLVDPANHSGIGPPLGQVWPPPRIV